MGIPINGTGWSELYAGNLFSSVWTMYVASWGYWLIPILFIVFQAMLYIKTKNGGLCLTTGLFLGAMITGGAFIGTFVDNASIWIIFAILVVEAACVSFVVFMK